MLASCMQNVGNHASTLLATPAAAPLTMAPLAVQVLIVGTAAVALCVVLTFGPLWKRDLWETSGGGARQRLTAC